VSAHSWYWILKLRIVFTKKANNVNI
jgi:hypothetical protein